MDKAKGGRERRRLVDPTKKKLSTSLVGGLRLCCPTTQRVYLGCNQEAKIRYTWISRSLALSVSCCGADVVLACGSCFLLSDSLFKGKAEKRKKVKNRNE